MNTIYYAIVRYKTTGNSAKLLFKTATERALALIPIAAYVTILEEGVE